MNTLVHEAPPLLCIAPAASLASQACLSLSSSAFGKLQAALGDQAALLALTPLPQPQDRHACSPVTASMNLEDSSADASDQRPEWHQAHHLLLVY